MSKHLIAACDKLGVSPDSVLSHRIDAESEVIRIVVDKGIRGVPLYEIPLSALVVTQPAPEPVASVAEEVPAPEPVTAETDIDLSSLSVSDLREMAKEAGIPYSGLRKADLIAALSEE